MNHVSVLPAFCVTENTSAGTIAVINIVQIPQTSNINIGLEARLVRSPPLSLFILGNNLTSLRLLSISVNDLS